MQVFTKTINKVDQVLYFTQMEINMRVNLIMIYQMEKAILHGVHIMNGLGIILQENIKMVKGMELELILIRMEISMKEDIKTIKRMVTVVIYQQLEIVIQDNLKIINCMVLEHILGQMEVNILDNMQIIKEMVSVLTHLQMEVQKKEFGKMDL